MSRTIRVIYTETDERQHWQLTHFCRLFRRFPALPASMLRRGISLAGRILALPGIPPKRTTYS